MKTKKQPGDKASFREDGKEITGKVREITFWRRNNSVAYKITSKGKVYWVEEARVK